MSGRGNLFRIEIASPGTVRYLASSQASPGARRYLALRLILAMTRDGYLC